MQPSRSASLVLARPCLSRSIISRGNTTPLIWGQGAPDFDGPPEVLAGRSEAVNSALNQYAPGIGMLVVREAIANHAARFYGQKLNPETGVLVTSGATEAVFAAILGLTDAGDEVIVFEPVYDSRGSVYRAPVAYHVRYGS
jgi:N-succinyldiaminopimelate aminotransferase